MKAMSLLKRVKHMFRTRFSLLRNMTKLCCICIRNNHTWTTTLHFLPVSANHPLTDYSWLREPPCTGLQSISESIVRFGSSHLGPFMVRHRPTSVMLLAGHWGPLSRAYLLVSTLAWKQTEPLKQWPPGLWMHCLLIWELQPQNLKCS